MALGMCCFGVGRESLIRPDFDVRRAVKLVRPARYARAGLPGCDDAESGYQVAVVGGVV